MTEQEIYRSLVYSRKRKTLLQSERLAAENKISKCLLALCYVVYGKHDSARRMLAEAQSASSYCLEAKALLHFYARQITASISLAEQIIEDFPQSVFARLLLAWHALQNRQKRKALEHYEILSREYPDHPRFPLYIAETLAYLGQYPEAMEKVLSAPPTFQRCLYRLLLPFFFTKKSRLIFSFILVVVFVLALYFHLTWWVFVFIFSVLFLGSIWSIKSGNSLLSSRLFFILVLTTIVWLLLWVLFSTLPNW